MRRGYAAVARPVNKISVGPGSVLRAAHGDAPIVLIITPLIISMHDRRHLKLAGPGSELLFLLHDVARLLRVDADKRARCHGMTRAQWAILIWLERQPGISQKELAELLEVEPISVARLIDRLEARGMVERRPDPRDRRIWRLHLSPPAFPMLREIEHQRAEITKMLGRGIDPATLESMTDTLLTMKTTLLRSAQARRESDAAETRELA